MKKKVFLTTASAVLALGVLAACGGADEIEEPIDNVPIEEPAEDGGLDDAVEEPTYDEPAEDVEDADDLVDEEVDLDEPAEDLDEEDEEETN